MVARLGALLLLLLPSSGDASEQDLMPNPLSQAAFAFDAVPMARGVYLLGRVVPGNAYAIKTSSGVILIDSGFHDDASHLGLQLREIGSSLADVRKVLITHIHADHSHGAQFLKTRFGATIYAGAGDAEELRAGTNRDAFTSKYSMSGLKLHPTDVDVVLNGGETIELGDTTITTIATPGHSPGSMCYQMQRDGKTILFTGDTISTLTAELGTYIARCSPRFRGDAIAYQETFLNLLKSPAPDLVLPGHTEDDPPGQRPGMSAESWIKLLQRGVLETTKIRAQHESDGADFLATDPIELLPGLAYLGCFRDWALYAIRTSDHIYFFDAPSGGNLRAFITERLQRLDWSLPVKRTVLLTSCDGRATGNVPELVDWLDCEVVAPASGIPRLKERCPAGTRFHELEQGAVGDLPLSWLPLGGIGRLPVAYEIKWRGKTVLITGRLPVERVERTFNHLYRELSGPQGDPAAFIASLEALAERSPDLWLPATVVNDQNANLYDDDWRRIVGSNLDYFKAVLK